MKYDDLLQKIGEFGAYQRRYYSLMCIVAVVSSFQSMNMVFLASTPEHRCKLPEAEDLPSPLQNLTEKQLLKLSIPWDSSRDQYDSCEMYSYDDINWTLGSYSDWQSVTRTRHGCKYGYHYSDEFYEKTIVTEWNQVCDQSWQQGLAASIFSGGRMVGALAAGHISDRFGRLPVFIAAIACQTFTGCVAAFIPYLWLFYILYFFQGAAQVAAALTGFVLGTEMVGPTYRKVAVTMVNYIAAIGQLALAGIAYSLRDWRHLELAISAPLVIFISYYWIMPESVRWLLVQNKRRKAIQIIRRSAAVNGVDLDEDDLCNLELGAAGRHLSVRRGSKRPSRNMSRRRSARRSNSTHLSHSPTPLHPRHHLTVARSLSQSPTPPMHPRQHSIKFGRSMSIVSRQASIRSEVPPPPPKTYSFVDILKHRKFAVIAFNVWFNWLVNTMVYYGLSLNTSNLGGDPYFNFFIAVAVEYPALTLVLLTVDRMGRKPMLVCFMTLAGITCIASAVVPLDMQWLSTTFSMVGKAAISASYTITYLWATEIFPTVVRNVGLGISSSCSRIGGMVAPQLLLPDKVMPGFPLILFGALSLTAGGLALLLPETRGKALPQDFEEAMTAVNLKEASAAVPEPSLPMIDIPVTPSSPTPSHLFDEPTTPTLPTFVNPMFMRDEGFYTRACRDSVTS